MLKKYFKENIIYFIIIIALIMCFFVIDYFKLTNKIYLLDSNIIMYLENRHYNLLIFIFKILTFLGYPIIPLLLIIILFFKNKIKSILLLVCYAFSGLIMLFTKNLIARPRPVFALIKIPSSYSFPSGHTLTSLVFYVILCYLLLNKNNSKGKNLLIIFTSFIFSLLIAFSRIYLGVHYFSDVVGGILLAIPCLILSKKLVDLYSGGIK